MCGLGEQGREERKGEAVVHCYQWMPKRETERPSLGEVTAGCEEEQANRLRLHVLNASQPAQLISLCVCEECFHVAQSTKSPSLVLMPLSSARPGTCLVASCLPRRPPPPPASPPTPPLRPWRRGWPLRGEHMAMTGGQRGGQPTSEGRWSLGRWTILTKDDSPHAAARGRSIALHGMESMLRHLAPYSTP